MPTSPAHTFTPNRVDPYQVPHLAVPVEHVALAPNQTLAAGTLLGQVTATQKWIAYAAGAADGSQNPKLILEYAVVTDANGDVSFGTTPGQAGGDWGQKQKTAPAYAGGVFRTQDCPNIDQAALDRMNATLISGTIADGIFKY